MKHKKVQITVKANGKTLAPLELGWVDSTRLDQDIAEERQRFSRVATAGSRASVAQAALQAVEEAHLAPTIVAVYENGTVRIINYIPEKEEE